ncbi:hypothetical protein GUJ93_ZPchr0001g31113 [Zizania palustris]|uniref:Uncharacterized protein n=1 Tax=Zizania palustris TaxID=103762 RepID=A0A8J5V2X0_ZIZPA|nr:hypothetical protein GUJ93_ZPchr0001g31113 [Zizania palustris]
MRQKKKGKEHGGLDVTLVHLTAGMKKLQLTRWESSHGTIIKGVCYIEFIRSCRFKQDDTIQIWAFKERGFRYFGTIFTKKASCTLCWSELRLRQSNPQRLRRRRWWNNRTCKQ